MGRLVFFFRAFGHSSPWADMELVGKGEVLWSETRGNRSHLLLSGQPSPSTASSSKVLRVVTSDFQNFHLTANKVCDWFVDVLIDDTVI